MGFLLRWIGLLFIGLPAIYLAWHGTDCLVRAYAPGAAGCPGNPLDGVMARVAYGADGFRTVADFVGEAAHSLGDAGE